MCFNEPVVVFVSRRGDSGGKGCCSLDQTMDCSHVVLFLMLFGLHVFHTMTKCLMVNSDKCAGHKWNLTVMRIAINLNVNTLERLNVKYMKMERLRSQH